MAYLKKVSISTIGIAPIIKNPKIELNMFYLSRIIAMVFLSSFTTAMNIHPETVAEKQTTAHHYLRVSFAHWDMNLYTHEAEQIFHQIETAGVAVFKAQPGFIRYRLMRADSTTTVAVAEWESEQLGLAGAEKYREWMRSVGIMNHIKLETHAGNIVAAS